MNLASRSESLAKAKGLKLALLFYGQQGALPVGVQTNFWLYSDLSFWMCDNVWSSE